MDVRVDFDSLPWDAPAPGLRAKTFRQGSRQIRLLELSAELEEQDGCTRAHAFHVLEGELSLRLRDGAVTMKAGDVGFLPGEDAPHKAVVAPGGRALLLLFETA